MTTWPPTSLFNRRAYGSENLRPIPQKGVLQHNPAESRQVTASQRNDAMGHEQTHAPQRTHELFDNLVGAREESLGDCQTKRLSGL
jgi:hypothetical protein